MENERKKELAYLEFTYGCEGKELREMQARWLWDVAGELEKGRNVNEIAEVLKEGSAEMEEAARQGQ